MDMRTWLALGACLALLTLPSDALATPALDAWRQLQDAADEREQHERRRRQQQLSAPPPAPAPAPAVAAEACQPINGLHLQGNRLLSTATLQHAAAAYLHPCLDNAQLNALLAALTRAYVNAGYITARPYLHPELSTEGALQVVIVEGQVEGFTVTDPALPLSLDHAFGDLLGQPLHLPTLERGLDQLNHLRVFDLVSEVRPGQLPGGSQVVLTPLSYPPRTWATVRLNNDATLLREPEMASISLQQESPLSLNDRVLVGSGRSLAGGDYLHTGFALYTLPYRAWRLSLGASAFRFRHHPTGLNTQRSASGGGLLYNVSLERELHRSQTSIISATTQLNYKRINSRFNDHQKHLQSPRYASVDLTLSALWLGTGSFSGQLRYSEGLGGWDANQGQAQRDPDAPDARFQSFGLQFGHSYASQAFGQAWQWNSQWQAQYSRDSLPLQDQLSLAGSHKVRGYRRRNTTNYGTGVAWHNTLTFPRRWRQHVIATPRLGLDAGVGKRDPSASARPGARLASAAAGINLRQGEWQLDLEYQYPLYHSRQRPPGGEWQASLELRF